MPFNNREVETLSRFDRALLNGEAYRASRRETGLANGAELILHIDPDPDAGNIVLETPRINPKGAADYDVFENADPGTSTNNEWVIHNMDYDSQETPTGVVTGVNSGGLDTTGADKTEESLVDVDNSDLSTGDGAGRAIYRNIPPTDTISLVITNRSGGGADFGLDVTLYEGPTLPG